MENQKKLRILCLHGFLTNSTIMKMQMRDWIRQFNKFAEFEFINGPYERKEAEVIDPRIKKIVQSGDSSYSWISIASSQYETDALTDIKYITDILDKQGPYDGIIGFSQGGAMVNTLLQFLQEKKIALKHEVKFGIIINAPFTFFPTCQISIPSIHFKSKEDEFYDRQMVLTTFYKNPIVIEHSFGHRIPPLTPKDAKLILGLLSKIKPSFSSLNAQNKDEKITSELKQNQESQLDRTSPSSNSQKRFTKDVTQSRSTNSISSKQAAKTSQQTPKL